MLDREYEHVVGVCGDGQACGECYGCRLDAAAARVRALEEALDTLRWEVARAQRYLIDNQPDNAEDVLRAALRPVSPSTEREEE